MDVTKNKWNKRYGISGDIMFGFLPFKISFFLSEVMGVLLTAQNVWWAVKRTDIHSTTKERRGKDTKQQRVRNMTQDEEEKQSEKSETKYKRAKRGTENAWDTDRGDSKTTDEADGNCICLRCSTQPQASNTICDGSWTNKLYWFLVIHPSVLAPNVYWAPVLVLSLRS